MSTTICIFKFTEGSMEQIVNFTFGGTNICHYFIVAGGRPLGSCETRTRSRSSFPATRVPRGTVCTPSNALMAGAYSMMDVAGMDLK